MTDDVEMAKKYLKEAERMFVPDVELSQTYALLSIAKALIVLIEQPEKETKRDRPNS